jgi:hypothetical protein
LWGGGTDARLFGRQIILKRKRFGVTDPKDEGFKVVDRRLFTETGELREEAVEQQKREEEAAKRAASAKEKSASKIPAPTVNAGETTASAAKREGALDQPAAEEIPPSRGFQMLVNFMTQNAAAMLGGMADPRTGQAFVDLEGAREMIDMLDALREKTKGNLSKEDDQLLIEVLGSLKLTFMEVSKAATEAMGKKAKKS